MAKTQRRIPAAIARKLPDKLSDMLEVALTDFKKILASIDASVRKNKKPKWGINMGAWVAPVAKNTTIIELLDSERLDADTLDMCEVCLAGACMVKTLGIETENEYGTEVEAWDFAPTVKRKLRAINLLRTGEISEAFETIGRKVPKSLLASKWCHENWDGSLVVEVPVTHFQESRKLFLRDMADIVKLLREHGC